MSRGYRAYTMPDYIEPPRTLSDAAANMAHFLMANGLGVLDKWVGKMPVAEQRKLFGFDLGRKTLIIDGGCDEVRGARTFVYGHLSDVVAYFRLTTGEGSDEYKAIEFKPAARGA